MNTKTEKENLRVLSGPSPICGQSHALVQGLKCHGVNAQSVIFKQEDNGNKYQYETDLTINVAASKLETAKIFLQKNIDNYDIFHFHAGSFLHATPWPTFPTALDLTALKLAGKKVYFHFRGSEVRLQDSQLEKNPYNYVESAPHAFSRSDKHKKVFIEYLKAICDEVFVVDREVKEYVGTGTILPIMLDLEEWDYIGLINNDRPLILHAPSDRDIKGTSEILSAVETLKSEGIKFDFQLVENLSISEARKLYERADIIIDQLKMGWYGTLTVESMALGKPVICYLREDLIEQSEELPIVNANPTNIVEILRDLIKNNTKRNQISYAGRDFALEHHCNIRAAGRAIETYQSSSSINPKDFIGAYFSYLESIDNIRTTTINEKLKLQREKLNNAHIAEVTKLKSEFSKIRSTFAFKLAKKFRII